MVVDNSKNQNTNHRSLQVRRLAVETDVFQKPALKELAAFY